MEKFKYLKIEELDLLPPTTGVYAFKNKGGFLYIGKAINIKSRVKNHISQPTFKDNVFVPQTQKIGFIATGSEIDALILEAILIKKYQPQYNTIWRDGKSHSYVFITKEKFPKISVGHSSDFKIKASNSHKIGPFIDGKALKQTLRILRRVFPFRTCNTLPKKACLYKDLNLCPAPCEQKIDYAKNIKSLTAILSGQKNSVIKSLQSKMKKASKEQDFEKAKTLRDQMFALGNVFSHSHILERERLGEAVESANLQPLQEMLGLKNKIKRIEGYDISNIQGQEATGSMVVFENNQPNKNEYRKFKVKISGKPNDTAMIREILARRLKHKEWAKPQLMLIDGGRGQLNVALKLKTENEKLKNIKIISLAKRNNELYIEGKNKPVLLKTLPQEISSLILQIRDESHRFAISFHKKLRSKAFLN